MPDNLNGCRLFLHCQEKEWVRTGYSKWLTQARALGLDLVNLGVGLVHNAFFFFPLVLYFFLTIQIFFPLSFYHFWADSYLYLQDFFLNNNNKEKSLTVHKVIFPQSFFCIYFYCISFVILIIPHPVLWSLPVTLCKGLHIKVS